MTSEWYPAISSEVDQTSEMRILVISISIAIPVSYALDFILFVGFDKEINKSLNCRIFLR